MTSPAKVTVEKRPNRAGGPHFFAAKPPKSSLGSLPPPMRYASAFFPAVESQSKQSSLHALLNSACRKGEDRWQS